MSATGNTGKQLAFVSLAATPGW